MADKCEDHTGCLKDIAHLQESDRYQWDHMSKTDERITTILTRLNLSLGGIAVACILLVIDVLLKEFRK